MDNLPKCLVDDCPRPVHAKGYCQPHYRRSRTGNLDKPIRAQTLTDPALRFWTKVHKTDTCWLWTGSRDDRGYGRFSVWGRNVYAHRYAYELEVGPIPDDGTEIDHLCRVPQCVRPDHLEAVTPSVNMQRSAAGEVRRRITDAMTHCGRGHERNEQNTYTGAGRRECRVCNRENERRYRVQAKQNKK